MGFIWDDDDDEKTLEPASPPPPPEAFVWDQEITKKAPSKPQENYEAVQVKVSELMREVGTKRELVRQRRAELRELRETARMDVEKRKMKWRAKINDVAATGRGKCEAQKELVEKLKDDLQQLERRVAELDARSLRAEDHEKFQASELLRRQDEQLKKAKATWTAAETKDFEGLLEKRRASIKNKVVKALEPQVRKLVESHREEIAKKKDEISKELDDKKTTLEIALETRVKDESIRFEKLLEKDVETMDALAAKEIQMTRNRHQAELQDLWDAEKQCMDTERSHHEAEIERADASHAQDLAKIREWQTQRVRDIQERPLFTLEELRTETLESDVLYKKRLDFQQGKKHEIHSKLNGQKENDVALRVAPEKEKFDADLRMVLSRLEKESQKERDLLTVQLEKERSDLDACHADALAMLKTQEASAMEAYLSVSDEATTLQSDVLTMERRCEQLRDQARDLDDELEQFHPDNGRQRHEDLHREAQARLLSEYQAAVAKAQSDIDTTLRHFATALEADHAADVAFHADLAQLQASHRAEFDDIEAKISRVLKRKTNERDAKLRDLQNAQRQNADRDLELNQRREELLGL